MLVAGVQQALRVGYDCAMGLKKVGKRTAHDTGDENAQKRAGHSGGAAAVRASVRAMDKNFFIRNRFLLVKSSICLFETTPS